MRKFEAEGPEFANILKSLEQFIRTVKGQDNFSNKMFFKLFLDLRSINQKSLGFRNTQEKFENALVRGNKITQDSREKKLNEMPQGCSSIPYMHVGLNKHTSMYVSR